MSGISRALLLRQSLADIVTNDDRAAAVFERAGLDYCCHGHETLEDAAAERGVPAEELLDRLDALGPAPPEAGAAAVVDLDALTTQIVAQHHEYVRRTSPVISGWLAKLAAQHGERHPELLEVSATFAAFAEEMANHMVKEEQILFPYIDSLTTVARSGGRLPPSPFGTVLNPIRMMEADHREADAHLMRLRTLTNGYTPPADGCTTYRLCYETLARYEADLHRHVHLENNVLFPRAIELERRLA